LEGKNKGITELADSIKRIGLISPLVVAPGSDDGRYRLIAGHRRFAACRRAGLKKVQVRIIEGDQREICEIALAENLFRKDLSPVEMAVAVVALIKEGGMDREQVASICHRSRAWVREQEEIVSWPADVQKAIHDGWLSVSAASNIALVPDDAHRSFLLGQAKEKGAGARTTAAWLHAYHRAVAHPDDETLWGGGTILMHPEANWTIIALCRKSDQDRSPKFFRALEKLGATGSMGDLDDAPEQLPLVGREVQDTILELLPSDRFDLIITHGLSGEYARHLRHEETGKAVMALWESQRLFAKEIWRFAYEDGDGEYLPRAVRAADLKTKLPNKIWQRKYDIITNIYGFESDSFEAKTTPRKEAFWCLKSVDKLQKPQKNK